MHCLLFLCCSFSQLNSFEELKNWKNSSHFCSCITEFLHFHLTESSSCLLDNFPPHIQIPINLSRFSVGILDSSHSTELLSMFFLVCVMQFQHNILSLWFSIIIVILNHNVSPLAQLKQKIYWTNDNKLNKTNKFPVFDANFAFIFIVFWRSLTSKTWTLTKVRILAPQKISHIVSLLNFWVYLHFGNFYSRQIRETRLINKWTFALATRKTKWQEKWTKRMEKQVILCTKCDCSVCVFLWKMKSSHFITWALFCSFCASNFTLYKRIKTRTRS